MIERIGAIVLAGGRSSRFGRDKLAEQIDGRPLLHHAIAAVQAVADEIMVVAEPGHDPPIPAGVRVAHDDTAFAGPLAGLAAGLEALSADVDQVVVVAGDMPSLRPAVLRSLLAALGPSVDLALLDVSGEPSPLPMAVRRDVALTIVRRSLARGERRLRALPGVLRTAVIDESTWRLDDPDGATLRDIDTPDDLPVGTDGQPQAGSSVDAGAGVQPTERRAPDGRHTKAPGGGTGGRSCMGGGREARGGGLSFGTDSPEGSG